MAVVRLEQDDPTILYPEILYGLTMEEL
ncbi:MAG: hypothetical protein RLZZ19_728, partial [Actinomycetota bacterium]